MNRTSVIHCQVTKIVLISYPSKFIYIGGIESKHIIVHRNGQAGVDIKGESDCLLAGEIPVEVEAVPERVPTVDG